jgi:glutamate-1-semialdehyde aminotransferase
VTSSELYAHAKRLIPGGTQLLSKRPELYLPEGWPAYFKRARGVEIEDVDGRRYVDVSIHSVGACPLGYADPDVDRAVVAAIEAGTISTLNCPEEVTLAERLCELHPWAEMVRYVRTGGEAMSVAIRLARAATGRDRVAVAGYHGWHDWYIAANLEKDRLHDLLLPEVPAAGVPRSLAGTVVTFAFGDVPDLERVASQHGSSLAAIVVEPARYSLPSGPYLEHVQEVAARLGAVTVFDEITSGFRVAVGGAHLTAGVAPDLAVFAKGMSNGYPMGAIIGRRGVMEAAQRTFISSTYWTERIGPVAALETIRKMQDSAVPAHLAAMGTRMRNGWEELAGRHRINLATRGIPHLPAFTFQYGSQSQAVRTLYTQTMLDQGFLAAGAFYPSLAHTPAHVEAALEASDRAFGVLRKAVDEDSVRSRIRGVVADSGLRDSRA